MSKTVNYLKNVSFEFEANEDMPLGPHIAFCTASVGGPASGLTQPVLLKATDVRITEQSLSLMKAAKEIRIETSMEEFLRKFFSLWYDDAAMLAKLLGFESSLDEEDSYSDKDYVEEKLSAFTIIKSLKEGDKDFYSLDYKDQIEVLKVQELFEKGLSEGIAPTDASDANTGDTVKKQHNKVGEKMTDKTTDLETLNKSLESLQKALEKETEARVALEKKEEARIEKAFVEKATGYTFVEDATAFGKLLKALNEEDAITVLAILDKAEEAIKNSEKDMFEKKSASGEGKDKEEISKAKQATREALKKQLKIED